MNAQNQGGLLKPEEIMEAKNAMQGAQGTAQAANVQQAAQNMQKQGAVKPQDVVEAKNEMNQGMQ